MSDAELEIAIQEVSKSEPKAVMANPAPFVDHSILKELETTGFIGFNKDLTFSDRGFEQSSNSWAVRCCRPQGMRL